MTTNTEKTLSWDDLCDLPLTTDSLGRTRTVMRPIYLAGIKAAIVPTRMHVPGWYIRSDHGKGPQNYWLLRSDTDYELIRQMCAAGSVTTR